MGSSQGEDASLDDSVLVGVEGVFDHHSSCTFGSVLMLATWWGWGDGDQRGECFIDALFVWRCTMFSCMMEGNVCTCKAIVTRLSF